MGTAIAGYGLLRLGFEPAPLLLAFVLGPRQEEDFRWAMLMAGGDTTAFVTRPISAVFLGVCLLLVLLQIWMRLHRRAPPLATPATTFE